MPSFPIDPVGIFRFCDYFRSDHMHNDSIDMCWIAYEYNIPLKSYRAYRLNLIKYIIELIFDTDLNDLFCQTNVDIVSIHITSAMCIYNKYLICFLCVIAHEFEFKKSKCKESEEWNGFKIKLKSLCIQAIY